MVFEDYFKSVTIEKRPVVAILFGFFFTAFSFLVALVLFRASMSITMVFLITLLLTPSLIRLVAIEELRERKEGLKHFLHNHKDIFEIYFFTFLGVFVAYVLIGFVLSAEFTHHFNRMFEFQTEFLRFQQGLTTETIKEFLAAPNPYSFGHFTALLTSNLSVMVVAFVLSFFYGASAIFLIILNASIFANFIVFVANEIAKNIAQGLGLFLIFSIHIFPEVCGFLLAALAGGVISKALILEDKKSQAFRNVFKDAAFLLLLAFVLIVLAAFLEAFVTTSVFRAFFG